MNIDASKEKQNPVSAHLDSSLLGLCLPSFSISDSVYAATYGFERYDWLSFAASVSNTMALGICSNLEYSVWKKMW